MGAVALKVDAVVATRNDALDVVDLVRALGGLDVLGHGHGHGRVDVVVGDDNVEAGGVRGHGRPLDLVALAQVDGGTLGRLGDLESRDLGHEGQKGGGGQGELHFGVVVGGEGRGKSIGY